MTFPFPFVFPATVGTSTLVDRTAGTNIGNMTEGGGLAAAFDGNTSQTRANSANKGGSASGYANTVGKDWGIGVSRIISRVVLYSSTDERFGLVSGLGVRYEVSNDGSSWTTLYQSAAITASPPIILDSGLISNETAYRYGRVNVEGNGANSCNCCEVEVYEYL